MKSENQRNVSRVKTRFWCCHSDGGGFSRRWRCFLEYLASIRRFPAIISSLQWKYVELRVCFWLWLEITMTWLFILPKFWCNFSILPLLFESILTFFSIFVVVVDDTNMQSGWCFRVYSIFSFLTQLCFRIRKMST